MKLYLCSYRIPHLESLIALADKGSKPLMVAYIPNAKDYYAERARRFKLQSVKEYLQQQGLVPEIIDLRDFHTPESLKEALSVFDVLWVGGGNTFCLRYEMQRSGFDQIVRDLLDQGIVYAGESAGACAAGKTLKGVEKADEPAFAEEVIWEGLHILDRYVLPHSDNPMFAEDVAYNHELYAGDNRLLELTDSEAYIINGDHEERISA